MGVVWSCFLEAGCYFGENVVMRVLRQSALIGFEVSTTQCHSKHSDLCGFSENVSQETG